MTMIFMLITFLITSAIIQVKCHTRLLDQQLSDEDNSPHHTRSNPRWLILRDNQGKTYKYMQPNNEDDFSVSYTDDQDSSTMLLLPPGILKMENTNNNSFKKRDYRSQDQTTENIYRPITTEKPKTYTNKGNVIKPGKTPIINNDDYNKHHKHYPPIADKISLIPQTTNKPISETNSDNLFRESEVTTSKIDVYNEPNVQQNKSDPILESIFTTKTKDLDCIDSVEKDYFRNQSQFRDGLMLFVENNIKLKFFLNPNVMLNKSIPINNEKNPPTQKDEFSTDVKSNEKKNSDDVFEPISEY